MEIKLYNGQDLAQDTSVKNYMVLGTLFLALICSREMSVRPLVRFILYLVAYEKSSGASQSTGDSP